MAKNELIAALEDAILDWDEEGDEIRMLVREYEKALAKAGFDVKKDIYVTKRGEYKTTKPVQICLKNRTKVLQRVYAYYYGDADATLEYCFFEEMKRLKKAVDMGARASDTYVHSMCDWRRFFAPYEIAKMPVAKIKKYMLHDHYELLVHELGLSRRDLGNAKTIANKAFDWAVNHDILDVNIARNVSTRDIMCRAEDNADKVYTDKEREILLDALEKDGHVASLAVALMFCLCVRAGEVRALKWQDINWTDRTIYIHAHISRDRDANGKIIYQYKPFTKAKSADGNRLQYLSDRAYRILSEQKKRDPFSEYVFSYTGHTPMADNMMNKHLKRICKKAGIPYMSTHKIRFWAVTRLDAAGVPAAVMQYMAGHLDPATTDHYKRVSRLQGIDAELTNRLYG